MQCSRPERNRSTVKEKEDAQEGQEPRKPKWNTYIIDVIELVEKCAKKPFEGVERIRNRGKDKQIERGKRVLLISGKDQKKKK